VFAGVVGLPGASLVATRSPVLRREETTEQVAMGRQTVAAIETGVVIARVHTLRVPDAQSSTSGQ